jgi:hypothetical protein
MRIGRISAVAVMAIGMVLGSAFSAGATTAIGNGVPPVATLSFVSQPGDYVGQGQSLSYTNGTSGTTTTQFLEPTGSGTYPSISVSVRQYESGTLTHFWTLLAALPPGHPWQTGTFPTTRMGSPTTGELDFGGDGRGCNASTGTLTVNAFRLHADGSIAMFDISFEQHCEQATAPALNGRVVSDDLTGPDPSYLAFASSAGDYVGQGQSGYVANPQVVRRGAGIQVNAGYSLIASMPLGQPWQTGTYASTRMGSATTAGVDFFGGGRGCNQSFGVLTVNAVRLHADGSVALFDALFEQHCESAAAPALIGHVVYVDRSSHFTFSSDASNPIGLGQAGTYWASAADFAGTYDGRNMEATVTTGSDTWTIDMTPPRGASFLPNTSYATEGSAHNNVGVLKVTRNGVTCSQPTGHLNIQTVSFSGSSVASLGATFDLKCDGALGVLNGELHINS